MPREGGQAVNRLPCGVTIRESVWEASAAGAGCRGVSGCGDTVAVRSARLDWGLLKVSPTRADSMRKKRSGKRNKGKN